MAILSTDHSFSILVQSIANELGDDAAGQWGMAEDLSTRSIILSYQSGELFINQMIPIEDVSSALSHGYFIVRTMTDMADAVHGRISFADAMDLGML